MNRKSIFIPILCLTLLISMLRCATDAPPTDLHISTFVIEEKVGKGKTTVDITLEASSSTAEAGIFVGDMQKDQGAIGYKGYCLIASKDALSLIDTRTDKITELASRFIDGLANGKEIRLRLEIDGTVCRGYLLDDLPNVDSWPEFELPIQDCEGYDIGYVSLTATPCNYRNLSVTYGDKTEFSEKTYTNNVYANYPDPDVLFYDGTYYLYGTGGAGGYRVHSSTDLVNWTDRGVAAPFGMWGISKNYWAPDVEYIDGMFYMVASCNENLGIAVSSSPLGPFKPITEAVLYKRAIDGHLFVDDDGRIYLYYVNIGTNSGIYGVELNSSMSPLGESKRLLYPTEAWEMHDGRVTEGPYMLKQNGSYYLTYSGSDYQSHDYAVGYAISQSPLGSYQKYTLNPIMIGNSAISGTAHHCIIPLPDREEMLIVYHCHDSLTQIHARDVCIDLIRFAPTKDGVDRLEVYGPTVTPQPYPLDKP